MQELAGFLLELGSETLFEMTAFSGGSAHNAIPGEAAVTLVFPAGREEFLRARARTLEEEIARWHGESDPRVRVTVEPLPRPERVRGAAERSSRSARCSPGCFTGCTPCIRIFPAW